MYHWNTSPVTRKLAMLTPEAGGVNMHTLNTTTTLIRRIHDRGYDRHHAQIGMGASAPTNSIHSWGRYIPPLSNSRCGPTSPLPSALLPTRTHQITDAVYAARALWQMSMSAWSSRQRSGIVANIHVLTPTCTKHVTKQPVTCAMNMDRGGIFM